MKIKTIASAILLLFVAVSAGYLIYKNAQGEPAPAPAQTVLREQAAPAQGRTLVVYFFHGRARCVSCKIIEALGQKALQAGFPEEMKSGRIVWRDIDLDKPENRHFIQEYRILSISLVLSDMENGEQKKWKNLEEVWTRLNDEKAFVEYVQKEIRAWL
jgi:hypothetical protein